jgi:YfiH family protein
MLVLTARNLTQSTSIAHGFFGRQGGVSEGVYASLNCGPGSGDARERVIENRRRAMETLAGGAAAKLVTLYQVHGAKAVTVTTPWDIGEAPEADAMATNVPGIALGLLTADCAPILLADPVAKVIGAAHAGWKGAAAGVIASAIEAMEKLGAQKKRIQAAIGPAISQHNYEVGPEFRTRFIQLDAGHEGYFVPSNKPDHWRFDLDGFVGDQLAAAGVKDIQSLAVCTYAHEDEFFSFRRATHRGEQDYGRDISAIMLKP